MCSSYTWTDSFQSKSCHFIFTMDTTVIFQQGACICLFQNTLYNNEILEYLRYSPTKTGKAQSDSSIATPSITSFICGMSSITKMIFWKMAG